MKKIKQFLKKLFACCPKWAGAMILTALCSLLLLLSFILFPSFADFYNRYPGAFVRALFATLTGWFPFSLAETLIMLVPLLILLVIGYIFRLYKKAVRDMLRFAFVLLAVLSFFVSSFCLGFAAGYRGTSLSDKLGLVQSKVSAEELDTTARQLLKEMKPLLDEIRYRRDGSSIMPYSLSDMNDKLQEAYRNAAEDYAFLPTFTSRIKPIVLSEPMTYTHISGVYSYFTGESNINTNFPDYTLPYTAAHELAHQRGIAKEDEANFIAFLVCLQSEDPYIRYSGYMSVYEYVISALYRADKDRYHALLKETDFAFRYEMIAYNEFFDKYEDHVAADISGSINNSYLQSQGQTAGSRSYGMVVDLAVAYYKTRNTEVS
ncbi:MAG: DUF3810 domain-containing protein [Ruminococcaceae bacterium]|nr:DUF3810 domain-containing protein [Oscillospiraceae bacterium]